MRKSYCKAYGCGYKLKLEKDFMCKRHWKMVPYVLQIHILQMISEKVPELILTYDYSKYPGLSFCWHKTVQMAQQSIELEEEKHNGK